MTTLRRIVWIVLALVVAYLLECWLQPRSKPPARAGATFEERLLSQTSYQIRRLMADLLWSRLDSYVHEGAYVDVKTGAAYSTYVGNLDVLALLDWVITLDPYFVEAYSTLASWHEGMGEDRKAVQVLEEAIKHNWNDPYVVEMLGQSATIRIRLGEPFAPITDLLEALKRYREGKVRSDTYSEAVLRGTLINHLYNAGRLLEARWAAMSGPHNLDAGHPALQAIGPISTPAADAARRSGDGHHEGDGHDHSRPGPEIIRHDPHHRPWMEALRMEDIQRSTRGALLILLVTVPLLLLRRRRSA